MQDHAKLKLAYDLTPTLCINYTLGWWNNDTDAGARSYLRDSADNPVYAGNVVVQGRQYNLNTPSLAFAPSLDTLEHVMQGLSVKSHTRGMFDWEVAASRYDYNKDLLRAPTATRRVGGIERGVGAQVIDFGVQQDGYRLHTLVSSTADWVNGGAGARFSAFNGNTALSSVFVQDTWTISQNWKTTLGGRYERWRAYGGELGNATSIVQFGQARNEAHFSPKAALAYQVNGDWVVRASSGRALRMPTVGELFQGAINGNTIVNTNPNLKPEASWTSELTAQHITDNGTLRTTLFFERTRDALYAQALTSTVSTVQNIDAIRTNGLELAWQAANLGIQGLDLNSSATLTDSIITANPAFPNSVGKRQPRVPKWRATAVASYKQSERLSYTLAARYSGVRYGQLDNSDTNGFSYMGFSQFFVVDARVRFKLDPQWSAVLGIDNFNNDKYLAFHPYPQRTVVAELKFDL